MKIKVFTVAQDGRNGTSCRVFGSEKELNDFLVDEVMLPAMADDDGDAACRVRGLISQNEVESAWRQWEDNIRNPEETFGFNEQEIEVDVPIEDAPPFAIMTPIDERAAELTAHRAIGNQEQDADNGKLAGYCRVCQVPWPCVFAKSRLSQQRPNPEPSVLGEYKMALEALYNVPFVGEVYDQQHSDTHLMAAQRLTELIDAIEQPVTAPDLLRVCREADVALWEVHNANVQLYEDLALKPVRDAIRAVLAKVALAEVKMPPLADDTVFNAEAKQ